MKSTTLALSLVALVAAFATLDMTVVHEADRGAGTASYSVMNAANADRTQALADADEDDSDEADEIEARLVNAFLVTERDAVRAKDAATAANANKQPMLSPAAHRCVTTTGTPSAGSAQYCFGAPAPMIYD
jgi:hypothetical protein